MTISAHVKCVVKFEEVDVERPSQGRAQLLHVRGTIFQIFYFVDTIPGQVVKSQDKSVADAEFAMIDRKGIGERVLNRCNDQDKHKDRLLKQILTRCFLHCWAILVAALLRHSGIIDC
jgi:hypothetical protein